MSDPSYAMQVAIAAALLADTAVTGLVGARILDELSAVNAPYPRIEIGDSRNLPATNGCNDPVEQWETLEVWASGPGGRLKAKLISVAALAVIGPRRDQYGTLLPPVLNVAGYSLVSALIHEAKHSTDVDMTSPDGSGLVARSTLTVVYQLIPTT
jgi:hypothetical protein